ncbi:MAG: NAD(P)H-dependent oxidoreductase [Pseudomonadota bacterium]
MKAHIVLAHPEAKSFNGHLARVTDATLDREGWARSFTDLYASEFDPCEGAPHYATRADKTYFHAQTEQRYHADNNTTPIDAAEERDKLLNCDLLVVHFPLWWFGMPAMLKGWIDRVFIYGSVYKSQMRYDNGICRGKKMIACITTGASTDSCGFNGREGDTHLFAWPMLFPYRYIGFDVLEPIVFHGIGGVASIEKHEDGFSDLDRYAEEWSNCLCDIESRNCIPYNSDDDFDRNKVLKPQSPSYSPFVSHSKIKLW